MKNSSPASNESTAPLDLGAHQLDGLTQIPGALQSLLVQVRRHLHAHPEVGFEEVATSVYLRKVLEDHGLTVRAPIAKTGLYTEIRGAHDGPLIGYRADIDALPIQDAKTVTYSSRHPGVAHLCGHDAHAAMAVGVAILLDRLRDRLRGSVRVFFQPNEEGTPGGAVSMVEEGILDGVSAVYALHVDPRIPAGVYGLLPGAFTAASDRFKVVIRAPGTGHAARPHEAVDTIWVAHQIMGALYQLVGRLTDARNPAVLTVGRVRGGEAYNVIPAEVEFGGTLRTTDPKDRDFLLHKIERLANGTADLYQATAEVMIQRGSPPVINDGRIIDHLESEIRDLLGEKAVYHVPRPSMGSEDFAFYLQHVPGAMLRVGTFSGESTKFPLHDSHFDIDEEVLGRSSLLMARAMIAHLERRLI